MNACIIYEPKLDTISLIGLFIWFVKFDMNKMEFDMRSQVVLVLP